MTPLYGHTETVANFVAQLLPISERGFGECEAIGVIDNAGRLVGGVVYKDWSPETGVIQLCAAAITPRWLTRRIMVAVMAYPFDQLGCQLAVFRVDRDNLRTRKLIVGMGGREYVIPRLGGRNKAEVIITIADDEWRSSRFMRGPTNGQEGRSEAA